MVLAKRTRIARVIGIGIGVVVLCPILVHLGRVWIPRVWGDLRFVNYFVAFIPTILSILFAFVIDKELERHMRTMWRIGIVACGILYSVALWHQQELTDKSNLETQKTIVSDAVKQANSHSDEKFVDVHKEVQGVKADVQGVKKDLADQIDKTVSKSTFSLNESIGKVGKPVSPEAARVLFSLWKDNVSDGVPELTRTVSQGSDGNFSVDFSFTDVSTTTAESLDVWILIGEVCSYVKEPTGFENPSGTIPQQRHITIPLLNPGTSFQKTTLLLKCSLSPPFKMAVGFKYSCKTCGKMGEVQKAQVTVVPKGQIILPWQK